MIWISLILTGIFVIIAGICDGLIEMLLHHYNAFKKLFPKAKDQFCNPAISWKNKYKNRSKEEGAKFLFSTNALVWVTDLYHLIRLIKRSSILTAISFMTFFIVGWWAVLVFFVLNILYLIGFYLIYK